MCKIYTLDTLPLNARAFIDSIPENVSNRRRLMDLGFFHGSSICPVFRSPGGDPTAYEILDTYIALRQEDAAMIQIIPTGGSKNV